MRRQSAIRCYTRDVLLRWRHLVLIHLLLLFVPICASQSQTGPSPQRLLLTSVVVSGADHVPCKDNTGADLPIEQYKANVVGGNGAESLQLAYQYPTAAIKGKSLSVTMTFYRPTRQTAYSGMMGFDSEGGSGITYNGIDLPASERKPLNVGPGSYASVTFTVGPLPNWVSPGRGLNFAFWPVPYQPVVTTAPAYTWGGPVYLVYDRPQEPQIKPWLGVLDYACSWAEGKSAFDDVARANTTGLFFAQRFAYSPIGRYWVGVTTPAGTFNLTRFLSTPGWISGDCVDVSCFLAICANALGLNFDVAPYTDALGNGFTTNPLCGIGSDPTLDSTYQAFGFSFHHITHRVGSNATFDAACAQKEDLRGNGYRNPPVNWALPDYWQTPWNGRTLGLVAQPLPSIATYAAVLNIPSGRWVPNVQ